MAKLVALPVERWMIGKIYNVVTSKVVGIIQLGGMN
jgi:hypothetical protein